MKTLGLIGGTSWHSTIEYYRAINEHVNRELGDRVNPPLILFNLDQSEIHRLQEEGRWDAIAAIYRRTGMELFGAGAEGIVFCANTPHRVYEPVARDLPVPILHIGDATGREANRQGLRRLGLLGTIFTMEEDFLSARLAAAFDIETIVPERQARQTLHGVIHQELCGGNFGEPARSLFLREIDGLAKRGAQGIILGCTEIPLLLEGVRHELPLLDTTALHARHAAEFILGGDFPPARVRSSAP